jgi:alkylation response protein AidB-like acyl-CoA dehydrogenase
MDFTFDEEQEALRESARGFLDRYASAEKVREAMASELGWDPALWRRIATELGWPAVTIPEAYGGLGLGYVELVALLEIMGGALLCAPFFSSICLGANALLAAGSEAIAAGEKLATLALTEADGRWDAGAIATTARRDGGEWVLDGVKTFVPDGHAADLVIVAARAAGTRGEEGVSLFAVPATTAGVSRRQLGTMDQTRRQAEVTLAGVRVPESALMGVESEGWAALERTLDLAAVALAAEQVGGAQRCLDMTVEYAKERVQFGRPIGSFQAVKHKCADMMLLVESARSAAYYAAWVASAGGDELPVVASLAKAYCSDAFFRCAAESVQIHGGVGFTWEYDVHLFFKRAKSTETMLGDPAYHRELVARRIGLGST